MFATTTPAHLRGLANRYRGVPLAVGNEPNTTTTAAASSDSAAASELSPYSSTRPFPWQKPPPQQRAAEKKETQDSLLQDAANSNTRQNASKAGNGFSRTDIFPLQQPPAAQLTYNTFSSAESKTASAESKSKKPRSGSAANGNATADAKRAHIDEIDIEEHGHGHGHGHTSDKQRPSLSPQGLAGAARSVRAPWSLAWRAAAAVRESEVEVSPAVARRLGPEAVFVVESGWRGVRGAMSVLLLVFLVLLFFLVAAGTAMVLGLAVEELGGPRLGFWSREAARTEPCRFPDQKFCHIVLGLDR
ncbi:hypothetical protein B0T26DRAFT_749109 [Lasiosphaeria miniovina]|uniref:Uncharacterized protein n=1 Tax=Lasiosphaeria miniovina TaxID=1954250 RepID=A0AA40AT95_9PEZI|nr:uncharacterized protein B0T26DRAFT_749109 [Lasiosphaeria miniovina]KAK0721607.1 hypothetical protein B0T26DRAFT_749109 [Lasiosphaeria miniovina]